jgi:putative endopeptidase
MDSAAIEALGIQPLTEDLKRIESIENVNDLVKLTAHFHQYGMEPFFSFSVYADEKNSSMNAINIWQDGIGLPDRDYYFREGERAEKIRASYINLITQLFILNGVEEDEAMMRAATIFSIESDLAENSNTRVENRSPELTYNKLSVDDLAEEMGSFDFKLYLKTLNVPFFDSVIVGQPKFIQSISEIVDNHDIAEWKTYFEWNLLRSFASHLSSDYVNASFEHYGKTMHGLKKQSPRWKKSLGLVNGTTGELLGQIYVKEYFDENSKQRLNTMVENLRLAFGERIKELDWMSPETKEKALKKISTFTKKIGYPDKWKDFTGLEITKGDHIANVKALRHFSFKKMLEDINQEVDKSRWYMPPQTVNAYYDPTKNEVVFPAGILQAPFYTPHADDAINYGAIGVVIGHEFTHGFDDQGSKYDEIGNLNDWWSATDRATFEQRTKVLVNQFNEMIPLQGYTVNGELTLGENIADLGGLVMAYKAFMKSVEGNPPADIDGYDYKQRFFLGYARLWRSNIRDEALIQRIQTDPHSPAEARVNGPLRNLIYFQEAWGCGDTTEMVISDEEKAKIW